MNKLSLRGLDLTEEEAFGLLELAVTSPQRLDGNSEAAIHKLADYCRSFEERDRGPFPHLDTVGR